MFDAVLSQILTGPAETAPAAGRPMLPAAVALRAVAPELEALSAAERQLVIEWLDRIIAAERD